MTLAEGLARPCRLLGGGQEVHGHNIVTVLDKLIGGEIVEDRKSPGEVYDVVAAIKSTRSPILLSPLVIEFFVVSFFLMIVALTFDTLRGSCSTINYSLKGVRKSTVVALLQSFTGWLGAISWWMQGVLER